MPFESAALVRFRRFAGVLLPLALWAPTGQARGQAARPEPTSPASRPSEVPASALQALSWRSLGPYRGGRSVAIAGDPQNRLIFYLGSTGGGVWKTENGGYTWRNVSDGYFGSGSIGAIAVSQSNPEVVYVGTGEACIRGNISHGDGVYRSGDGGKSWTRVGLEATRQIGRIRVHPGDPDVVYVAALGHAWGPNPERGVFRSADGGRTWEKVLFPNERTGAIDLAMDPRDPQVLYAATWEARRYPWGLRAAGPSSGLHKSTDGGRTWTELTRNRGLPEGTNRGRIGIAVSPANAARLWAIIEAERDRSGVYRSDDAGVTWQLTSQRAELLQRPWYYHHIVADPKDPETVYVLNTSLWKSTDGGRTYIRLPAPHGDIHDLWIDPRDPSRMAESNDGGGTVSFDGGKTWSSIYNQPTAQFYHVTTDNQFPYRVYGNQQDNSTLSVPSRSDFGEIGEQEWYTIGGSEDGYTAVRPDDPNIVYSGDHYYLTRYDHRTRQVSDISPWPEMYWGWGGRDLKYRFQWVYPVILSPHDPNVLYVTSQFVHKSTNEGRSWEIVSPDLTRADPKTLEPTPGWGDPEDTGPSWGPIKRDNTGIEWYATVFAFDESPAQPGVLWAGSDDGLIHVSRDGGKRWESVTPKDLPEFTMISIIEPSPHDAAAAYVAATRYKLDDLTPYLYKTSDYGRTWNKITNGIRENDFTRVIREDPQRRGLLYAGTETGAYVSIDDGGRWQPLQLNLPLVPIHDMEVKGNELAIATHGRSFWILDGLHVLRQLTGEVLASTVHLFQPEPVVRFREGSVGAVARPGGTEAGSTAVGTNPPNGVVIYYYLGQPPAGEVTLTITDATGEVVRRFARTSSGAPEIAAQVGLNRFVWENMRYPGPLALEGAIFRRHNPRGPLLPPGSYRVTLAIGGASQARDFEVGKDPRIDMTPAQYAELHRFLLAVRDKITETHQVVLRIRGLRSDVEAAVRNAEAAGRGRDASRAAEAITRELYRIEEQLIQFRAKATQDLINYPTRLNDKLSTLFGLTELSDAPPTAQAHELFRDLSARVDAQVARLQKLVDTELAQFRRRFAARG
ncbi:MAG: glycosyl hydrolase [Gemmatimonadetes bacterium]|nr:glycosyl hydrolase [Gemmatimonadota bacterium]